MAIEIFPVPVTASSINASSITATSPHNLYQGLVNLEPAIYTITCINSTIAKIQLFSGDSTLVTTTETISGTVTINLGTAVDRVRVWTDTGSSVVVTFTKVAAALSNITGTIDVVTSTGTYTGTSTSGYGYAVLVGGGGGGGGNQWNRGGASSGGSGGVCSKYVQLTGSMAVTIGAFGSAGIGITGIGTSGGTPTFAGMSAGGGAGGEYGTNPDSTPTAAGGVATGGDFNQTTNGTKNGINNETTSYQSVIRGPNTPFTWSFLTPSNSGVLGTGGDGTGYQGRAPVNATGYGAGGGGGMSRSGQGEIANGSNGAPGVLLVLRI
jgi:hypothetical protein